MHLLFYGKEQVKVVESKTVEHLLKEQSVKVSDLPCQIDSLVTMTAGREDL